MWKSSFSEVQALKYYFKTGMAILTLPDFILKYYICSMGWVCVLGLQVPPDPSLGSWLAVTHLYVFTILMVTVNYMLFSGKNKKQAKSKTRYQTLGTQHITCKCDQMADYMSEWLWIKDDYKEKDYNNYLTYWNKA